MTLPLPHPSWAALAGTILLLCAPLLSVPARAQDITEDQVQAGLIVWRDYAGCNACHGYLGEGGKMQDTDGEEIEVPGLRRTAVELDDLPQIISCGMPLTPMPFNLAGAWVTEPCYGTPLAAAPPKYINPGAALTKQQMADLLAFLIDRVVGKRVITKAMCVEIYGNSAAPECATYE